MTQIKRIEEMEARLDRSIKALKDMEAAMDLYEAALADIDALELYYVGDEWREDFEADEKGLLPEDLKRGVLSEDGIYNMLDDNRGIQVRIAELLAEVLKNT